MGLLSCSASLLLLLCILFTIAEAQSSRPRPAYFVFGDSLVDSGNNNYLATTAKANMYPYGIDSRNRQPSGRFSNGFNIPDIISQKFGAEPVLPYLDPNLNGNALLRGANFASAGVGILNDTGFQFLNIIRMPQQFKFFEEYQRKVSNLIGQGATATLVSQSLVSITLGGNDYVNNYYLYPGSARSIQFNLVDYTRFIVSKYMIYLRRLYELGARRILVTNSGPLGCSPGMRSTRSVNGECAVELQNATFLFNSYLDGAVKQLNEEIGETTYVIGNSNIPLFTDPQRYGFRNGEDACCGQGRFNGAGLCTPFSNLCPNRNDHVYWDNYHPSERAIRYIVDSFFSGLATLNFTS